MCVRERDGKNLKERLIVDFYAITYLIVLSKTVCDAVVGRMIISERTSLSLLVPLFYGRKAISTI
jgi:hypothetical protein